MNNLASSSESHAQWARRTTDGAVFDCSNGYDAAFLDEAIPLRGASHADVARYSIEIPMRYSECFAVLNNGTKVPMANKRQFLAWSGTGAECTVVFDADGRRIQARVTPTPRQARRFVAIDGALFG